MNSFSYAEALHELCWTSYCKICWQVLLYITIKGDNFYKYIKISTTT